MDARYLKYYLNQRGRGIGDIGVLHRGPLIYQRGRGIGSVFGSIIRTLQPLVLSGLNVLKDQSLKTGGAILRDIGRKPLDTILKEQGSLAVEELAQKGVRKLKRKIQGGEGIKRKRKRKNTQLKSKRSVVKTQVQRGGKKKRKTKTKTKKKRVVKRKRDLDIFD